MLKACTLIPVVAGAFLITSGRVAGQEVAGDVMIPPPRELAVSTSAASGLRPGQGTAGVETMAAYRAAVERVVSQVQSGSMSEAEAREQLGDFTVSLLIKAGVVSFGDGARGAIP